MWRSGKPESLGRKPSLDVFGKISTLLGDALRLLAEMHGFLDAMRDHVARLQTN
jgi:hypothetical protein